MTDTAALDACSRFRASDLEVDPAAKRPYIEEAVALLEDLDDGDTSGQALRRAMGRYLALLEEPSLSQDIFREVRQVTTEIHELCMKQAR